jgi:predicted phage terminase large subunit-like protein
MTAVTEAKMDVTVFERNAICRLDFPAFAQSAFAVLYPNEPFSREWCHEAIAVILAGVDGKTGIRQIINAPPRSLKSFLVSVAWPAFILGHKPSHKIVCASYSQDLANHLASDCRRLIESGWYRRLFPTRLAKSTEEELVTMEGGFRIARSVGGTLTGLGGQVLIIDDPLNANDALSDANRASVNEWFTRTLYTRLNNKALGTVIVVMQRLHQDDLTGHLIEKGGWDLLVLPAIAPRDMNIPIWQGSFLWRAGEPLQKREPLNVLDDVKRQLGASTFNAHYLQDPVPELGNMLKREWLKWYEQPPVQQPSDEIIQSWDTALKVTTTSDYSVCLTFLVRNSNEYYLIDVFRKRLNFPDLCSAVDTQAKKHRPNAILVEEQASGTPLIDECKIRKGMSNIFGWRPKTDKRTRMNGETPKLESGCLVLPKSAPWQEEFLMEYLAFPNGRYDDQIDALSQFLNWRTTAERRGTFHFDFGHDDHGLVVSAPSAEEVPWRFGGARLSPPFPY